MYKGFLRSSQYPLTVVLEVFLTSSIVWVTVKDINTLSTMQIDCFFWVGQKVEVIMENVAQAQSSFPWDQLVLKLIDWPFLLFLIAVFLIFMMKDQLKALVDRSNVKITWGDRSIELNDLADNVDQDMDPIKERIDLLEERLAKITADDLPVELSSSEEPEPTNQDIDKVINVALANPKYKYRTVSGVAREANIPIQTAQKILTSNPKIRVVKARDGKEIYAPR
ncbi:hypothetical protein [Neptunomonas japonica]|nr:hypothetical protein [Neptunomonas japonica]